MLKNVLDDYLSRMKNERAFDAPLLALLATMGFYDLHFTHGQVEFGKDFIGKLVEDGKVIQYSFQSKCGDINQKEWRNEVQGQMLEAVTTGLSHPGFDTSLPHQSVLVTTGRLNGNSALGAQDLNKLIIGKLGLMPIKVWDKLQLVHLLALYGVEGVHSTTAASFISFGRFFIAYGKSCDGDFSAREIEAYSREWIQSDFDRDTTILVAVLEAEILAAKCQEKGFFYEAAHCTLGALRAAMYAVHTEIDAKRQQRLTEIYKQTLISLKTKCSDFILACRQSIAEVNNDLFSKIEGPGPIITYPLYCFRIMEVAGLLYFLTDDTDSRSDLVDFLSSFVSQEPGCNHLISDGQAVALALTVLTLCHAKRFSEAKDFLTRNTVWVCDRYEDDFGLASFGASAFGEVATLLGSRFEGTPVVKHSSSFAATLLCDLAAFLDDPTFYEDVVNDFKACSIAFSYWQPQNSSGQFLINADDIIQYPNIEYQDKLQSFDLFQFAEHIVNEPRSFKLSEIFGPVGYLGLITLLRDRYFPTLWPQLMQA